MKDLEEVVTYREALTLRPPDHPHRFTSLNNLAYAVLTRSNQLGSFKDSEEEITLGREALTLCSPGNPDRSIFLTNLANTLVNRCQRLGSMEAITCYLEALTFCPPGHPDRSIFLNSLTNVDFTRHKQSGSMEDLKKRSHTTTEHLLFVLWPPRSFLFDRFFSLTNFANGDLNRYDCQVSWGF